ncbi:MAG: hypothetical protein AAF702_49655 [Chloroflexota bacterium]
MSRYVIVKIEDCPSGCVNGIHRHLHPDWERFWKENFIHRDRHGQWQLVADGWFMRNGLEKPADECIEVQCEECNGIGMRSTQIDIRTFLAELRSLAARLRRPSFAERHLEMAKTAQWPNWG